MTRLRTSVRESFRGRSWQMYLNRDRDRKASQQPRFSGESAAIERTGKPKLCIHHRLRGGQLLPGFDDWQVIHTPGHSWDSCCYYHADSGSLITGDTLLGSAKENRLVVPSIYASRQQTLKSLGELAELPISAVYPGHGSAISGSNLIGMHNLP